MKTLIVFDGISFHGGSKVATHNLLRQFNEQNFNIHILTKTPESWKGLTRNIHQYYEFPFLEKKEHGAAFFIKHFFIFIQLARIYFLYGRSTCVLGASGPGVDFAAHIFSVVFQRPIIQMIHGPVAASRSIGRALLNSDLIISLDSSRVSILNALDSVCSRSRAESFLQQKNISMKNGLSSEAWPSPSVDTFNEAKLFWAASLLKWKGLDILIQSLDYFEGEEKPFTRICYIKPSGTDHEVSRLPSENEKLYLHESPNDLDTLRAQSNIFISTSQQEPFGLSILEAMAAGLCIVIPKDGAFWDKTLIDGIHCMKYQPDDPKSLFHVLNYLRTHMEEAKTLACAAQEVANSFRLESTCKQARERISMLMSNHTYLVSSLVKDERI